jgi:hypothetical protein
MQRYSLFHDGSDQSWQATFLAFHVTARLGATLQVHLVGEESDSNSKVRETIAQQVAVGGRAAGITIETQHWPDFAMEQLEVLGAQDGLIAPFSLFPNIESILYSLEFINCPLWLISQSAESYVMAILAADIDPSKAMIDFARALSARLQSNLKGLTMADQLKMAEDTYPDVGWHEFLRPESVLLKALVTKVKANLLVISHSDLELAYELDRNLILHPSEQFA